MNKNSTATYSYLIEKSRLINSLLRDRIDFWIKLCNYNVLKPLRNATVFLCVLISSLFSTPIAAQQTQPVLEWSTYFGGSTRNDFLNYLVDENDGSIWFGNLVYRTGGGTITTADAYQTAFAFSGTASNAYNSHIGKFGSDGQFEYGSYFASNHGDFNVSLGQDDDYVYGLNYIYNKRYNVGTSWPTTANNYGNANERGNNSQGFFYLVKIDKTTKATVLATELPGTEFLYVGYANQSYYSPNTWVGDILTQDGYAYFGGMANRAPRDQHGESWAYIIKPDHTGTLIRLDKADSFNNAVRMGDYSVAANGDLLIMGGARGNGASGDAAFLTTDNTVFTNPEGNWDNFLRRYDRDGNLIFSTLLGGSEHEIVIDASPTSLKKVLEMPNGTILVCGGTSSSDFPYTDGSVDGNGNDDIFLAAYAADGTKLWVKGFIADGFDVDKFAMKVHPDGQQIIIHTFGDENNNFVITPDAIQPNYGGGVSDQYIAFIDPITGNVNYGTYYGGSGDDGPHLGAANDEDIFINGNDILFNGISFNSTDYPTTPGATNKHFGSFLVLDGNGQLQMATTTNILTEKVFMNDDVIYAYGSYDHESVTTSTLNALQSESNAAGDNKQAVVAAIRRCDGKVAYQSFLGGRHTLASGEGGLYDFQNTAILGDLQPQFVNGKLYAGASMNNTTPQHPTTEGAFQSSSGGSSDLVFFAFDMEKEVTWEENELVPATQSTCTNGIVGPIDGSRVTIDPDDLPKINRGSLQSYTEQKAVYQWQVASSVSGPWADINGAVQEDYQHNDIGNQDIFLRRIAFNPNSIYCNDTLSISNVHTIIVSSDIAPTAVAGDPARICPGETWPLGGSPTASGGVGPYTYRWEPGTGLTDLADTIAENPTAQPSVSTIYTVEVTDNNGCIALDQVTVNVWTYTAGEDQAMCFGETGVRIGSPAPAGVDGVTYSWTVLSGDNSSLSCTDCARPIASPSVNSIYRVEVSLPSDNGGSCVFVDQVSVIVASYPGNNFAGQDRSTCFNNTNSLSGIYDTITIGNGSLPTGPGYSYQWSPLNAFVAGAQQNQRTIKFSNGIFIPDNIPQTYTLTMNTPEGCVYQDQVKVYPLKADLGNDRCSPKIVGDSYNPDIYKGNALYTYNVLGGVGGLDTNGDCTSEGNSVSGMNLTSVKVIDAHGSPGQFTIVEQVVNYDGFICRDTVRIDVCVSGGCIFDIEAEGGNCPAIGPDGSLTLVPVQESGSPWPNSSDWSFEWTNAADVVLSTGYELEVTNPAQAWYYLKITSTVPVGGNDPCSPNTGQPVYTVCIDSILVNRPGFIRPEVDFQDTTICFGDEVGIGQPGGGFVYEWTDKTGTFESTEANPMVSPISSNEYYVVVTDPVTSCFSLDTVEVTVLTVPISAGDDRYICNNAVIQLGGNPAEEGLVYQWIPEMSPWRMPPPNTTTAALGSDTLAQPWVLVASDLEFILTVTDTATGCMVMDTLNVYTADKPQVNMSDAEVICAGQTVELGPEESNADYVYEWTPAAGLSCTDCAKPIASPDMTTDYQLRVSYADLSCPNDTLLMVNVMVNESTITMGPDQNFCPGDGSIQIMGAPATTDQGNAIASYSWSPTLNMTIPNIQTPTVSPPPGGETSYTVTIEDINGCMALGEVTYSPEAVANAGPGRNLCLGEKAPIGSPDNVGTIVWTGVGGAPVGALSSAAVAQPEFDSEVSGLGTFEYQVSVTSSGCTSTDIVTVTVIGFNPPEMENIALCRNSCGVIGFESNDPDLEFFWSPTVGLSDPTSSQTMICVDSVSRIYEITIRNTVTGCVSKASVGVIVTESEAPEVTVPDLAACYGQNLILEPEVVPETGNETYDWSPTLGLSNPFIKNPTLNTEALGYGVHTYELTVTDEHGCMNITTMNVVITESGCCTPPVINTIVKDASCGMTDGGASIVLPKDPSNYSISWSPMAGTLSADNSEIEDLGTGVYNVTVVDTAFDDILACAAEESLIVGTNTENLVVTEVVNEGANCNTGSLGTVVLSPNNYVYSWSDGGIGNSRTDLAAGCYMVEVTAAGSECSDIIEVCVAENGQLEFTAVTIEPDCELSDGSIVITPVGGMAPYSAVWSDGQVGLEREDLESGIYTVTLSDATGCSGDSTFVLSNDVAATGNLTISTTDPLCAGEASGSITFSGNCVGCTEPVEISVLNSVGAVVSTTSPTTDLLPGTYTVVMEDATGCWITGETVEINDVPTMHLDIDKIELANCNDEFGSIYINVKGGSPGYTYLWGPGGETTQNLIGVDAGTYTIEVTDANGCVLSSEQTVGSSEDCCPQIGIQSSVVVDSECGMSTGTAAVVPTGSPSGYTFNWYNANDMQISTDSLVTGLLPGAYRVVVRADVPACTDSVEYILTVGSLEGPRISITSVMDATCADADGSASVMVEEGVGPYTYLWSNGQTDATLSGVVAGTYSVVVTDGNGCTETEVVTIGESSGDLTVNIASSDAICNTSSGMATLTIGGGTSPYTYLWSNGSTDKDQLNLAAGVYSVVVTDGVGCSVVETVVISNDGGPELTATVNTNVLCIGDASGVINLSSSTPGAIVELRDTQGMILGSSPMVDNLWAGTYYAIAYTELGCRTITILEITEPEEVLDLEITSIELATCEETEGSLSIDVMGGTAGYSYLWSNGATSKDLTNIGSGSYSVVVTDASGCKVEQEYSLGNDINCSTNLLFSKELIGLTSTGNQYEYLLEYYLITENQEITSGYYNLYDSIAFANGVNVIGSPTVNYIGGDGMSGMINSGYNGVSDELVVMRDTVGPGASDTVMISFLVQMDFEVIAPEDIDCDPTNGSGNTGLTNVGTLESSAVTIMDTVCVPIPLPPDTVYYTVPADSMITSCADLTMLPGPIASVNSCEDPSLGSIGSIDQGTGCVVYTAPSTPGVRDTFCLVVCNDGGICDTTITIIEVPLPPDTVYYTVPADSMITSCVDLSEIPGSIASVNSCEDPSLGSIGNIDQGTGCVEYTAPSTPGVRDTFCLVVCDEGGICDTTITIIEVPLPPDTVYYTVPADSMITSCVDLSEIPGSIVSVNSCEDPSLGSIGNIDQGTGCVEYTAPSTPGVRDTFCLVVCDEGGICDTTITIIEVPLPPDTVYYTVPADSMITSCVDLSEIPGSIASVNSCEDPSLGSIGNIDQGTGCVEYTAPSTPGVRDTFCLVVCDEGGICDTTITIIEVPLPPDTVYYTVPADSMITSCVDLNEIPGSIASVNSCEDPSLGSIGIIDQGTGCVEYTAPSTPGVRDTFCLVVCDEGGICDTTITIIEVPLPPDTVYYTVPPDSMITSCVDLSEIPGSIASVNSCEDPSLGSIGIIDQGTGCVEYTAPSTPGVRDTFCLVVCDEGGICDTTITIIEVPLPPDTVYFTVPPDSMITSCVDLSEIPGSIASVNSCEDPSLGSIGNIDQGTGCVEYTAPSTPGVRDTFCLVVCDEGGICDTTITIIEVPLPLDTVYYTVPADSMITSCVDLNEIPGSIASVNSCEDPSLGSIGNIDQVTGCVEYTAPSTPGVRDTFCLVVCDEGGICDTTITIIEVPLPPDTVYYTVPADSMITSCVDLSEIPGSIVSVNSCEDPSLGSIGNIDQGTGCVEYTAPSTPGVRDTFCLVVCDEGGICDTTITIIEVPLPPDTVYYTVPPDSMITSCVDLSEIPGSIASVNSCEDPSLGSIGNIDQGTGCVEYTAPSTPGVRDTFCLVVCNDGGICDTTITIIEVPLPPDTVYYTVPADSMITSCVDLSEIPGSIVSVNSCEYPSLGSIGNIDQGTGCVEYTAPSTPGVRDTFCLVVCNDGGICDTTITIIEVPLPPDTVYYTVPADSMITSCVDLSEIPGSIASVNSCEDPSLGSIGNIDQGTGCVEYTAPSTPGVRDTFCLVVCDEGGICDTTITIIEVPLPPDTVYYTVPADSMITSCVDLSEIPGSIVSVNSCEDPSLGSIGNIDQGTGCVEYTAPSTPGVRDTFCLVVCDEGGICDTTITIIEVPLPPDTVYYTVPADSMITSCVDLSEIPGSIASVNSCEDPSLGSIGNIDQGTGCVEYTAPSTPGVRDTFCLVVCDEGGICDTTITIIEVPLPPDTVYYTVPADSMITSCVDLNEIPGSIASVNSCEDPSLGSIGIIDQGTGCVEYTAPSTPGVRDTFCLVVCDEGGICDTTITIIEVPLPPDTVYYTVPPDSMITSCVDLSEIPGSIASVNSCEDPSLGSIGIIDQGTGCVEYTAPSTPGVRDTFCLVVCDEGGICDTTITIIEVPLPPDTVYFTVPPDSMITSCVDLSEIPGSIASVNSCEDPSLGSIGNIDQGTGCVEYTAPSTPGVRDTFCLVVCDEGGICDTTITIIEVPLPLDTVYYTVPADSMITSCVDLNEIPGSIASVNSCEDPSLGSIGNIDQVTGCVEYTAPSTPGVRDTFCLVVCDEGGICDTTITIIEVPLPPDTVYYTVPADSMITSCVDLSEIPGSIVSVNSCEDPSLGSIGNIDQGTGCVEYTAPSTPGVRDTFCLVVCDEGGICDTTITIIEVPLPPDTVYYTVPPDSMITSCVDLTMIPGAISSVSSCGDPLLGSIGSIDQGTGCVEYTAPSTPGVRDTFCLVVCDEGGICDTTITIIEVPLPPDTVYYTVPADSMVTSCVDLSEIPGPIASVNSCEDPSLGSIGSIDQVTGCVEYTAPSTPGVRDTFCLVVCDEGGICDTTITIIEVPLPPDTVYYTVPADSMITSCVDLTMIPGAISSVSSCGDPSLGSIGSIDQVTGCVEYTAPSTLGVRDTFCLVVCDEDGICDTTVTIIEVPVPGVVMTKDILIGARPTGTVNEYTTTYVIRVEDTTGHRAYYDLSDTIKYGLGANFISAEVSYGGDDGLQTSIVTGNPMDTAFQIVDDEYIENFGVDSYYVEVTFMIVPEEATLESADCDYTNDGGANSGLTNIAVINDGVPLDRDTVCQPIPVPGAELIKTIVSGPLPTGNPLEYLITYNVSVRDTMGIAVYYDLSDTLKYGAGAEIQTVSVNYNGSHGLQTSILNPNPNDTAYQIVMNELVDNYDVDEYLIDVVFRVNPETYTPENGTCVEGDGSGQNHGLTNIAVIDNAIPVDRDTACADIPLPCTPMNCHGYINMGFGDDCEILVTADMLLIHGDLAAAAPEFYKVELFYGPGLLIPDNILRPEHVGRTITARVTSLLDECGGGSCESTIVLDKPNECIISNTLDTVVYCIDPFLALDPWDAAYPKPEAINVCGGSGSLKLELSPDWITPVSCEEESDTAEIIYREWTATTASGGRCSGIDTIVVFRLPKLTPESFVVTAEDSSYCELEAVSNEGESLKRYAAWKQPVGLHDYELPYAKLKGLTYELPAAVIIAGMENASAQGEEVFEEYLECVILKKASGAEITIGDIVSGDYMDELLSSLSQKQLGYGFLQGLVELSEDPINIIVGNVYNFYPYLLLQIGDRVLTEGGRYEEVEESWFYSGTGNSPYWFAGGWPSIYDSGDCVSYCDTSGENDFECIKVKLPRLTVDGGFDPVNCDTVCLSGEGVHCGITIRQEATSDWTGTCPKTRGVDTWITQTCWASTPNTCVSDSDYCEQGGQDFAFNENVSSALEDYSCSSKSVKVHISQWQTLIDTLAPIFDFCYPSNLDQSEIMANIRSGQGYLSSREWELENPTTYGLISRDCEAEVYVPDVRVIDNCSGVSQVKAMVDVAGGSRAVIMERTSTEIKLLANGDTCYIYTYSHRSNPFSIPFKGCDGELTEVRYEAADNCWNVSEWYKYLKIEDDLPPTVVLNEEVNVSIQNKIAWVRAETFDEGSWDNCSVELRLVRRSDWLADSGSVDLCNGSDLSYDNWVDLLEDLGVDRSQALAAVNGSVVGEEAFNEKYDVAGLGTVLNEGEVELYYHNQIKWLWEDSELNGDKVVHGYLYAIAGYIAENCSSVDEHGNRLKLKDLELIFDRLFGQPGYSKVLAHLGGGWSKSVPFHCEDACAAVDVELAVFDYCCNFGIGSSRAYVEDKSSVKLVRQLPDLAITCESYNVYYKDIVEGAAALGENGSENDENGIFAAMNEVFGYYLTSYVDNQGRAVDKEGNLLSESELNFDYYNISCGEESQTEQVAVIGHDGIIDWVNKVSTTTYLDTTLHSSINGVVSINCSAMSIQDVWVDLDECGQGTITRRFIIRDGCGSEGSGMTFEQVIHVASACGLRASMFDLPEDLGSQGEPICLPEELSDSYFPDTIGRLTLKPELEAALCNLVAIGKQVKSYDVVGSPSMKKYEITWIMSDWCGTKTSSTKELTYTQVVVATIDPSCNVGGGTGDVSLVSGQIKTELGSAVSGVDVKAVLGQWSPIKLSTSESGDYSFSLEKGSELTIVPSKNTGFSNGISTADIIDILSHVLQKNELDSKYKRIAADVNGNGQIEALDVLELRKLVLNPRGSFANNTSWRFYDTKTDNEIYEIKPLTGDERVDFTAVKIGDVNLSSDPASSSRSVTGNLNLNMSDKKLKGGEIYHIDVRSDNFDSIKGLQYTLNYADAYVSVESILPGALNITEDNYLKYRPGVLTASWNDSEGMSVGGEEVLFTIVVKAKSEALLRDILTLNDLVTKTEAYSESGELRSINLQFNGDEGKFALYQNTPNPYKGETIIGFVLPESGEAVMTIYNVSGRLMKTVKGDYSAGYNEVRVRSTEIGGSGVLYYQLTTDKHTATKKMIVVD